MTDRAYDVDHLTIGGKAGVEIPGVKKGDRVIAVCELVIGSVQDRSFASQGDQMIAQTRLGEVMLLTDEEYDDYKARLAEQRREREGGGTGDITDPNGLRAELMAKKTTELREILKERGASTAGGKQDLVQRLVDLGG